VSSSPGNVPAAIGRQRTKLAHFPEVIHFRIKAANLEQPAESSNAMRLGTMIGINEESRYYGKHGC